MKKFMFTMLLVGFLICLAVTTISYADQIIVAKKVARAPGVDGIGTDSVWAQAQEYTTYDEVAKINITLKAVYTGSEIFFLVIYPDSDASTTQKTWIWNKSLEMYKQGPDREDLINFIWNMEPKPVDLSLKSDDDYMADVWFWKACRTDPVGYADDKYHRYSSSPMPKAMKLTSKTGKTMYLIRTADSGTSACKDTLYEEYKGDKMPRYTNMAPTGSAADVRAKGVWTGGRWTIELGRALNTGNGDDIQFDTSKTYLFGVSRYEISGGKPEPDLSQPLYNCGDVSEALTLQFGE